MRGGGTDGRETQKAIDAEKMREGRRKNESAAKCSCGALFHIERATGAVEEHMASGLQVCVYQNINIPSLVVGHFGWLTHTRPLKCQFLFLQRPHPSPCQQIDDYGIYQHCQFTRAMPIHCVLITLACNISLRVNYVEYGM